ncbi:MAG: type II toxin-antitoxin system RelE/ParE family toxin [Bacilli bacterium]|nr:type II toxin-antitoxin system RelE/ParE family toxin [Bacilli bacterium]
MGLFKVEIEETAHQDIATCVAFVLNVSKEAAIKLVNEIYDQIHSLESYPERNPLFEMQKTFPHLLRKQIINKRYLAIYSIEGNLVKVYRFLDSRRNFESLLK